MSSRLRGNLDLDCDSTMVARPPLFGLIECSRPYFSVKPPGGEYVVQLIGSGLGSLTCREISRYVVSICG